MPSGEYRDTSADTTLDNANMSLPEGWPTAEMIQAGRENLIPYTIYDTSDEDIVKMFNAMYAAAPTPPAQDDAPDYWLIKNPDQDDPFLVDNKDTLNLYLQSGYKIEKKLYTRPNDRLRKASEKLLRILDQTTIEIMQAIVKLRAALEEK